MFCPNCGKQSNDDAKFCYNCGNQLIIINNSQSDIVLKQSNNISKFNNYPNKDISYTVHDYMKDFSIYSCLTVYFTLPQLVQTWSFFNDLYSNVNEKTSQDEYIEITKIGFDHIMNINIYSYKNDLEIDFFNNVCEGIIDDINQQTKLLSEENKILSQFLLDKNSSLNFSNQLHQIFIQNISNSYSNLLSSIQIIQSKKNMWNDIIKSKDSENILSGVLNFAGGALAVANPLIGIPMLIGNYFRDKQKEENRSTNIDDLLSEYDKFIDLLDNAYKKRIETIEKINKIITDKINQAIFQRNELLKEYKSNDELCIIYNHMINNNATDAKNQVRENNELSFMIDMLIEEDISQNFKNLLK